MTKKISLVTVLIAFFTSIAIAQESDDQEVDDRGFFVGASLLGTSFQLDIPEIGDETDTGGGIAIEGGYNFSSNFAVFISLDGSQLTAEEGEDYNFVHFDAGVEGRLGNYDSKFRPFGRVSLLGAAATIEDEGFEAEISGSGFGAGLGLYYFLNEKFAFKLGYTHSWININEITVESISIEIDEDGSSGRLGLGFTYNFW